MNRNLPNEELVNSYFDNKLSETERMNFESKLQNSSDLREEYNFQKDLINGIKEARRIELKSRLNNIPINTPIYQTIGFKVIAALCISAGIGISIYYSLYTDNILSQSLIDIKRDNLSIGNELPVPKTPKSITQNLNIERKSEIGDTEKVKTKADIPNTPLTIIEPVIVQPNIVESFEDESIAHKSENINKYLIFSSENEGRENVTIEISNIKNKRNKFHYKFSENKLYLIGNFNNIPYEIIELNSSKGKTYFLHYDDSFYRIIAEQLKPTPLVKIENDSLINDLRIIQSIQDK